MGWETRAGKRVYYRKVREGERVRSIYCGSGERAEKAAKEDEDRRCATGAVIPAHKKSDEMANISHVKKEEVAPVGTPKKEIVTEIRDVKKEMWFERQIREDLQAGRLSSVSTLLSVNGGVADALKRPEYQDLAVEVKARIPSINIGVNEPLSPAMLECLTLLKRAMEGEGHQSPDVWLRITRPALKHPSQRDLARKVKQRYPDVDIGDNALAGCATGLS
jgi:hypothetical protein